MDEQTARRVWEAGSIERAVVFDKLPVAFQNRILGFRQRRPDTFWKYENAELAACRLATAIVYICPTAADVVRFIQSPMAIQLKQVPVIAELHASGHDLPGIALATMIYGGALALAQAYRTDEASVSRLHAVMCPLAECVACGCWATVATAN